MGHLIAFEGIDKSGKGTQSKILAERLGATRIAFPRYETPLGEAIRRHLHGHIAVRREHVVDSSDPERDCTSVYHVDKTDPLVFQCMMLADKVDAQQIITGLLPVGDVVLDRWVLSGMTYGLADGLDTEWLMRTARQLVAPEVTFVLRVPAEVAVKRGREKGDSRAASDRYEADLAKMKKVAEHYELAPMWLKGAHVFLDGTKSVSDVSDLVWAHAKQLGFVT